MDENKNKEFDSRSKLSSFNWLGDIPGDKADSDIVEVQFKNARKGFYRNVNGLELEPGELVAVEASPGHDIGRVLLTGLLAQKRYLSSASARKDEIKKIFRKAKPNDLEKYEEAKKKENATMIESRKIAESLGLKMKIGDVEYQGDGNKAIFYYIAEGRVDFRQLIKVLAETFKVRIEMKQIGVRQEAGRIGGLGPCGRPLCCSGWMTNFVSVSTAAARFQDLSLNPQKLAGQCAKLKCCLNFEVDAYVEASKRVPPKEVRLETADATWYHFKTDIFKREISYSTDKNMAANVTTISAERAFEIIRLNKNGEKPLTLAVEENESRRGKTAEFGDILGDGDLTRFDKKKKKKRKNSGAGAQSTDNTPKKEKNKPENAPKPKSETTNQNAPKPKGDSAPAEASTKSADPDAESKRKEKRQMKKPRAARREGPSTGNEPDKQSPQPKSE